MNIKHKVIIIDDVVDKETQDLIEQTVFGKDTQWTLGRSVFYEKHPEVTEHQKNNLMSFTKSLLRFDDRYIDKDAGLYCQVLQSATDKLNMTVTNLLTARLQLQPPVPSEKPYGVPHVDGYRDRPYMVGVYYVNDSDGDTVMFKQTIHNTTPEQIMNGELEIDSTISPKKGRFILFDGDIYHAVGKPTKDFRCIINYNFYT